MNFSGKVAIVTGGGSGIGRATAERLAKGGASLIIVDLDAARVELAVTELTASYGTKVEGLAADVSLEATAEAMVQRAIEGFGRLDILVNAAGIHHTGDIHEVSLDDWNRLIGTNLTSMFLTCRAAIPAMAQATSGSIVNLGSVSSFIGQEMQGKSSFVYNVTKAGIRQLTTSLATRHASDGIRVNCVCPGAVRTRMSLSEEQEAIPPMREAILAAMAQGHPMARVAEADEIAAAIVFLASDEASFITGAAMPVDGGYLAR
jgi:NAD(P)-dependent dehydrogenase (short-subunit alcohol dehydrogenase family)